MRRVFIEKRARRRNARGHPPVCMIVAYAGALRPGPRPKSETTADTKSFGFAQGRCAEDTSDTSSRHYSRSDSPEWVLEGDIKGCFDHIEAMTGPIKHIPMDKSVLKQFLESRIYITGRAVFTDAGTPLGRRHLPILAKLWALDGMQKVLWTLPL